MPNFMTKETKDRLLKRLHQAKTVDSIKVSKEIGAARELGDLKENAEYHAARDKQNHLMAEIRNLESKLSNFQVIEELPITAEIVSIGTVVEMEDLDEKKKKTYTILGADDTDLEKNRISYLSPLAKGLIGKKPGVEVEVDLPDSTKNIKILSIKKFGS